MGGAFSNGQDNDELVDNLVDANYIRTKKIEQVFRAVDRGDYFLSFHRENAYKDFAWKHGNIHLSAPCIYCEVMEELSLQPGLSFLNLGSGTGYLSTMAGLLLTQSGINHGIELHEDCVKYAYDRLEEFKQKSLAVDEFDFCEPVFVQGNCLSVMPGRRYDRVYCGATCPESHQATIRQFVKVGGILVMPYKDHLVKAKRIAENTWEHETILPVSFANLVIPTSNDVVCQLPDCDPLSLQELCRGKIRRRLRANIWREHTDLETCKPITLERNRPSPPQRALRQFVIPIFEESDDESIVDDSEDLPVHRTQLMLNIDSPPGENLRTRLQFVRAVIQPNRCTTARRDDSADEEEPVVQEHEHDLAWALEDEESPSTEDTNFSSERERHDSESSSDSACDKSRSENPEPNNDPESERPPATAAYENMSESESEPNTEEAEAIASRCLPLIEQQRKKACRKETGDSGIVEDASGPNNDDASLSSDSEFANGTPVKHHKRSSSSGSSSSSATGNGRKGPKHSGNNDSGSSNDNNNASRNSESRRRKRSPFRMGVRDSPHNGHYIDTNAFSSYLKEKIQQLPLPYPLKLYINYNRAL